MRQIYLTALVIAILVFSSYAQPPAEASPTPTPTPTPAPAPAPAPAAFSLSNLTIQPAEVEPGEELAITVDITNTGGTEGSYTATLMINGVKEADKSVPVAAGGTKTVTFSVTREDAGSYNVVVDGLSGSFTVVTPASAVEYVIGGGGPAEASPVVKGDPDATYVGAEECKKCHSAKYEEWKTSGHPYILMTPEEAQALRPDLPVPEGYTWDDIQYVTGGWAKVARYIGKDGYFITMTGANRDIPGRNMYNIKTKEWEDYYAGEVWKYVCQNCHNTGAAYEKGTHQDGLEGIRGTWEFRGVQCEACHGPGSEHIAQGGGIGVAIVKDDSAAFCGQCHGADPRKVIIWIYDQFLAGGMSSLKCVSCHDPHKGVFKGATNPEGAGRGIKVGCESCHSAQASEFNGSTMQAAGVKCTRCHMPEPIHLFTINTDPNAGFSEAFLRSTAAPQHTANITQEWFGSPSNGYLTVEDACLKCHTDETRDWALAYAEGIHSFVKVVPPEEEVTPPEEEEVVPPEEEVTPPEEEEVPAPTGVAGWVWVIVGLVAVAVILAVGLIMALSPYVRRVVRGLFGRGKDEK